jgi:hypothetical protein
MSAPNSAPVQGDNSQQQMMNHALARIEDYLLPSGALPNQDNYAVTKATHDIASSATPEDRMKHLMFQIALADYIRTMQTMYRDNYDEQKLAAPLREDLVSVSLPTKHLMSKLVEARSRAIPLLKLTRGENSISMLKGYIDLASCYALQGLWPQVEEKLGQANETLRKYSRVSSLQANESQRLLSIAAAERVSCVYSSLRSHAIRNNGQILLTFVKEVMIALVQLPSHVDDISDPLGHPSKFAAMLHTYFTSYKGRSFTALKQAHLADSYFPDGNKGSPGRRAAGAGGGGSDTPEPKSWGDVVDYLRSGHCEPMSTWVSAIEELLLPQDKASLSLPFRLCDLQQREIAHPIQLSHQLLTFPGAARALINSKLPKVLSQIKVEVPLFIDARTGMLLDFGQLLQLQQPGNPAFAKAPPLPPLQQVYYELPITKEEFLALFVLDSRPSLETQTDLLKVQLYTIQGVCHIYTDNLSEAEVFLKKALNILEKLGLEMEIVSCELYNSIAQMMIMQHRKWVNGRKDRLRDEATAWLDTEDGKKEMKQQNKLLKRQYSYKSAPITTAELELRTRENSIKKRMNVIAGQMDDRKEMNKTLEASYRYLVRSFEILERVHGPGHPSVGTACLAVASVQNILEDYEDTRDWLVRALRYMEKFSPVPHRAISFTQMQLSQVLSKLGHDEQSRMLLSSAAVFHMSQAHAGLLKHNNPQQSQQHQQQQQKSKAKAAKEETDPTRPETARSATASTSRAHEAAAAAGGEAAGESHYNSSSGNVNYSMVSPPILKNTPLFEEITVALETMSRVMRMSTKCYDKWQAATQAEEIARLTEMAFGWDSAETAEAQKQVSVCDV